MSRPRKLPDASKLPVSINLYNRTEKDSYLLSRKNSDSFRTRGTRVMAGSISKADIIHVEAGRVKDGFTQFVESQACEEECSAAKKPSSLERATQSKPEDHRKAAKEFYEHCADLLPSPAGPGHPMRSCPWDEDVGKKKLEVHERALPRSDTPVVLFRSSSQTVRSLPPNVPPKAVQHVQPTSRTSQDAIVAVRRDKPQPPLPKEPVQKRPSRILQKRPTGPSWPRELRRKDSEESISSTASASESIASSHRTLVSEPVDLEPAKAALGSNMLLEVHCIKLDLSKTQPSTRSPQLSRSLNHDTITSPSISHQAEKQQPSNGSHVRRASQPDSLRQAIQRKESDELPPKPHSPVWLDRSYRGICPTAEAAQNPSGPADSRLVESKPALGTVKQKRFSPFMTV